MNMTEHITQWLGAYHDGELRGTRLLQVENHLAECVNCRAELEEMRSLSTMLKETAPQGAFLSSERFAASLALRLSRQPEVPQPHSQALKIGWWLVPLGALGIWLFIEVTFTLRLLILGAADAGLLGANLAWMRGAPLQMSWFAAAMNLFGSQTSPVARSVLSALNDAHLFITQVAENLLPQVLFTAIYLGWLAAWWLGWSAQSTRNFSQS